jgi:tRNA modification GTPase
MDDTIAAVATAIGESSINIIRLSGKNSILIANKIFSKDISNVKSHTIHYGYIMENNEKIDEVLLSVFLSPKSFTTEDVVEISVHGGSTSVNKVMELLLSNGARLAEPGEFLKRAFLNGRIDLTQAEAVGDLIKAQNESSRKMAIKGIDKKIYNLINELKEKVLTLIANIEVNIDYPEYEDAVVVTKEMIKESTIYIKDKIIDLLNNSKKGLLIKNGLKIVIV